MSRTPKPNTPPRTATIRPDRLFVGVGAISLVMIVMLASMIFSFNAITEAASWTGNPALTHPLAPVFIDGAILTYTISFAIFRWRGDPSKRTLAILYLFTLVSVAVNFAHTAAYWKWDFTQYNTWFGILIAVSAPIAALLASEEVVRLSFARMGTTAPAVAEPVPEMVAADVEPEPEPVAVATVVEPLVALDREPDPETYAGLFGMPPFDEWELPAVGPDAAELEIFGGSHNYVSR